jgi:AraC-like DNA-binding protein
MRVSHNDLRETHIVGDDTPEKIILPKVSPLMRAFHIGLAGVSDAGEGFDMVRPSPHYGHILACFSGRGRVLVNGRWQECGPGMAYLTPPAVPHAYHTVRNVRWGFAWIWWHLSTTGEPPLIDCARPMLVPADPEYLRSAILGLYRESIGPAQPTVLDHWVDLVHAYAARLGQTAHARRSLITLWEQVDANLAHPWTRQQLADTLGMSGENLRRLCQRETGRGPMHHLTALRMQRAAVLLESTTDKIEKIARAVGYANAFAFSTAFKRHQGIPPAAFRDRRRKERRPAREAVRERKGRN